jgi:hypothetical protein
LALVLVQLRWLFMALAIASLGVGFYFNVYQMSSLPSRTLFWFSSILTAATVVHWGWWIR